MNRLMTIIFSLFLISCTFYTVDLKAEEDTTPELEFQGPTYLAMVIECWPYETLAYQIFEEFGEQPFAQGTGIINSNGPKQIAWEIFVNADKRTVSITFDYDEDNACLLLPGANFQPHELLDTRAETKVNHID